MFDAYSSVHHLTGLERWVVLLVAKNWDRCFLLFKSGLVQLNLVIYNTTLLLCEPCSSLSWLFLKSLKYFILLNGIILFMPGRNGRYQLQSSRNIIAPSALSDSEETLNQGNLSAVEIFTNLRSKSVLHLFASIGKFLGLQVISVNVLLIVLVGELTILVFYTCRTLISNGSCFGSSQSSLNSAYPSFGNLGGIRFFFFFW